MADPNRNSSMEEELLRDMIEERDKKIVHLQDMLETKEAKIAMIRKELEDCRIKVAEDHVAHLEEVENLSKRRATASKGRELLEHSVMQQNGSLHNYAEILRVVTPGTVDSSYVVRMQSQLCKAMHSMGILEHQLEIVKEASGDIIKLAKDGMNSIIEERTEMEVSIMSQLMIIDKEARSIEDDFKSKLDKKRKDLQKFQDSMTEFRSENFDDDSDDDDSDDEDIEIDDDLLREIIDERKEECDLQKIDNEAQQARIKELEEQIQSLVLQTSKAAAAKGEVDGGDSQ
jgi:hypothetical protein